MCDKKIFLVEFVKQLEKGLEQLPPRTGFLLEIQIVSK